MKIDVTFSPGSLAEAGTLARRAEEDGFDGIWVSETGHDPFLQLVMAAEHANQIQVGTAIALAFTRSPTTLAHTAWDLQRLSGGRLTLGLGSQVRSHILRRFSGEWFSPVARMREVIMLLRTIWNGWQNEAPLDFRGRFYTMNLMTGFFSPGPIEKPDIPIYLAAVNRKMCSLAGELCQGVHVHPLHTVKYLKEVMLPAVEEGRRVAGRGERAGFEVTVPVFAATGQTDEEIGGSKEEMRRQVAFYASTKSYSGILELHGWGDAARRLHEKSVRGDWAGMPEEVPDMMLDEFVIEGRWDDLPDLLKERYRGLADRLRLYLPYDASSKWRSLAEAFG